MKVLKLLNEREQLLNEMTKREFELIYNGLKQIAKRFRLRLVASYHVENERVTDGAIRADVTAVDLYRTVEAAFKHPKNLENMEKHLEKKELYEVNVFNVKSKLNVILGYNYHKQPRETSTPYDVVIVTAKYDPDFKSSFKYPHTYKIHVNA